MKIIGMPEPIQKVALAEFEKQSKMSPQDSEGQKIRTYLEC